MLQVHRGYKLLILTNHTSYRLVVVEVVLLVQAVLLVVLLVELVAQWVSSNKVHLLVSLIELIVLYLVNIQASHVLLTGWEGACPNWVR